MGNHYDEQVLIIKTSWGGRALAQGFMPPSSMPSAAEFEVLTTEENAKNTEWNASQKERITKNNLKIMEENKTAEKEEAVTDVLNHAPWSLSKSINSDTV